MTENYEKIKRIIDGFNVTVVSENQEDGIMVISDQDSGIDNLIIDCEDGIAILAQVMIPAPNKVESLTRLMQLSDQMIHGAFVINENGDKVIWKDTVRLADLDPAELTAPINALRAFVAEHLDEIIELAA